MWASWPQACILPTCLDLYGDLHIRRVSSNTGKKWRGDNACAVHTPQPPRWAGHPCLSARQQRAPSPSRWWRRCPCGHTFPPRFGRECRAPPAPASQSFGSFVSSCRFWKRGAKTRNLGGFGKVVEELRHLVEFAADFDDELCGFNGPLLDVAHLRGAAQFLKDAPSRRS